MTDNPRGVYRTKGVGREPNKALLESGTLGLELTEEEYRAGGYEPAFDELPWCKDEDEAPKEHAGKPKH